MVAKVEKRKQSLYFPGEMLDDLEEQALRQDRSMSWVIQQAWRLARERIRKMPGTNDFVRQGQ